MGNGRWEMGNGIVNGKFAFSLKNAGLVKLLAAGVGPIGISKSIAGQRPWNRSRASPTPYDESSPLGWK